MAFPTFRADFNASSSLPSTVYDPNGIWVVAPASGYTLTQNSVWTASSSFDYGALWTSLPDSLNGNITFTSYFRVNNTISYNILMMSREVTQVLTVANGIGSGYFADVASVSAGSNIAKISGVQSFLLTSNNTNVPLIPGSGYCFELRTNTSGISYRLIRQSDGASFSSGTGGAGIWAVTTPPNTFQTYDPSWFANNGYVGISSNRPSLQTATLWNNLIYDPSTTQVDFPIVNLVGTGTTKQLTAGGFTDPMFGVTWQSSNTSVATVSTVVGVTGLVTAVGFGTATITAIGNRDTTQVASSLFTISAGLLTKRIKWLGGRI